MGHLHHYQKKIPPQEPPLKMIRNVLNSRPMLSDRSENNQWEPKSTAALAAFIAGG